MYGSVATRAKHSEVFGLGFADSARQRDSVMCFDQVEAAVVVFRDTSAGLTADLTCLGPLAGKILGQSGRIPVTFSSKVRPEDFAPFGIL